MVLHADRELRGEADRLERELSRLADALADGGGPTIVTAIRQREQRKADIAAALAALGSPARAIGNVDAVVDEAKRRIDDWRSFPAQEAPQARAMLRTLLPVPVGA